MNNIFRIIAFGEGISFLLLLFVAVPLKYKFAEPQYVGLLGPIHGALFIGYIILAIMLKYEQNWDWKKFRIVCLASVLPGGTFYVEKKYM